MYQNVAPKTIVAKVGNSGNCWTSGHKVTPSEREDKLGAHLHLSVYKATKRIDIWSNKDSNYVKNQTLRNPFDRNHNFKTDGDL